MASIHVNFRIKKEEKELIDLINSQSNLSDFMRDLLKKELTQKDVQKENIELKKELDSVNLKLDTLQQSINMINMLMTSSSIQMQPVTPVMNVQTMPVASPQLQQSQEPETLVKKIADDDMDDDAFDSFDSVD